MRQFYFTKEKGAYPAMPKPRTSNGNKNMIGKNLMRLRWALVGSEQRKDKKCMAQIMAAI